MRQDMCTHILFVFITSLFIYIIYATKEFDLEVNTEKIKYMLMYRHQNAEQNHNMKIANRPFENVAEFKYLGTTVVDQNLFQDEIKRRLNSGNACYHSVQNFSSSRPLVCCLKT
jgi:hypothetical protein